MGSLQYRSLPYTPEPFPVASVSVGVAILLLLLLVLVVAITVVHGPQKGFCEEELTSGCSSDADGDIGDQHGRGVQER